MHAWLSRPIDRATYLRYGLGLSVLKYSVEAALIYAFTNTFYAPWAFVLPLISLKSPALMAGPGWLGAVLLLWTLPFLLVGLLLSVRRCLDVGWSPWTAFWLLCPLLNLPLIGVLAAKPSAGRAPGDELDMIAWAPAGGQATIEGMRAVLWGLSLGAGVLAVGVYVLRDYGMSLFLVTPILMSAVTAHQFQTRTGAGVVACLGLSLFCVTCALGLMLLFALEGLLCVIMAMPIVYGGGLIGGFLGFVIAGAAQVRTTGGRGNTFLPAIMVLPAMLAIEHTLFRPILIEVVSTVEIAGSCERVWPHVIAFRPIASPPQGMLAWGIAYPLSARIDGSGQGAVRYCEFSTGAFVEPITVWSEPHRLAFNVTSQPCPMTELSPYRDLHPPHLDGFMRSERGEFQLIELPNNRMRLEGRTWYTVDMFPQSYWQWWSDSIVHAIHMRVLKHIKEEVEQKPERIPPNL